MEASHILFSLEKRFQWGIANQAAALMLKHLFEGKFPVHQFCVGSHPQKREESISQDRSSAVIRVKYSCWEKSKNVTKSSWFLGVQLSLPHYKDSSCTDFSTGGSWFYVIRSRSANTWHRVQLSPL